MPKKSISQMEKLINEKVKTAFIYSVDDLFFYIIEIRHKDKSRFINEKDKVIQFGNLETVRGICHQEKVERAFIALSKTYQEVDGTCDPTKMTTDRFDYFPFTL